ncbi:MAG: hypothetical protein P8Y70_07315 [Candidatus Lokiarchaeota archaeon]
MKNKHYFQDLIEILTNFKVGLLLLDEELNVEEILNAEERSINRDKITNIREKIIKVKNITNFLNEVLIESKITPNKVHVKYIKIMMVSNFQNTMENLLVINLKKKVIPLILKINPRISSFR